MSQAGQANTIHQSEEDIDLAKEILDNLKKARAHFHDWRANAKENYDFYAGVQWDQEDASRLEEQGRIPVVFNRVARTINAVTGVEVQNRQEVKYYPRNIDLNQDQPQQPQMSQGMPHQMGGAPQQQQMPDPQSDDQGFAEMMNEAASWAREQTNAEDEESEMFVDTLICGEGWTEMRMDYEDDPQGIIKKDRVDPLFMLVDPNSSKRNHEDAKWLAYVKEFTKKEAREMFPELDNIETGTFWNDQDMLVHDADDDWKYINDYSSEMGRPNMVTIVQYQYYVKEPEYVVLTNEGEIINLSVKKYNKLKDYLGMMALKAVRVIRKKYKQCFLVGKTIRDKTDLDCDSFTFKSTTGLRDRNRRTFFGLIDIMKDPQRWANKWMSQIQYILNSNSKGGLLVEEGAVEDIRQLEDDWTSSDSVIHLLPGGLGKIQQKGNMEYPEGIDRLLNYAVNAINDITGVNLEMLGTSNRDQPIGLEVTRQNAGITVLATFFDSLRRYRKADGKLLAHYIREYISDGRLIRIIGDKGIKYIPLIKSNVAFDYDIIVDDSPTSTHSKEKTFYLLNQIIPMAQQANIPIPKEVLEYAPLPFDLVQKWKEEISKQQAANQPDPQAQQMQQELQQIQMLLAQLEVQQKQADVEKTSSETVKNMTSAAKDRSIAEEQEALALQQVGESQAEHNRKVYEINLDDQRKNMQMILEHYRKTLQARLQGQGAMDFK